MVVVVAAGSEFWQQVTTQSQSAQLQGTMVNSVTLYVTFTILSLHTITNLADIYFGNQGDYGWEIAATSIDSGLAYVCI